MRGYSAIGLVNPKTAANIGSVFRAAGCYGASMIVLSGNRFRLGGIPTDTQKAWRHIPVITGDDITEMFPFNCVPVAVDLVPDAQPLHEFRHPERAFYIFGPEDGTLGKKVTDRCAHKIMIPTNYCMNLAATVNVVLYDRQSKLLAAQSTKGAAA